MRSGGKIYSGSKIKEVPQYPTSVRLSMENQSQEQSQCGEILCVLKLSSAQPPTSLACAPGCSPSLCWCAQARPGACMQGPWSLGHMARERTQEWAGQVLAPKQDRERASLSTRNDVFSSMAGTRNSFKIANQSPRLLRASDGVHP